MKLRMLMDYSLPSVPAMMIALNICVLLNWPNGGVVDLGAESFGLEADDASLGVGAVCEHVIFAPDAVDA